MNRDFLQHFKVLNLLYSWWWRCSRRHISLWWVDKWTFLWHFVTHGLKIWLSFSVVSLWHLQLPLLMNVVCAQRRGMSEVYDRFLWSSWVVLFFRTSRCWENHRQTETLTTNKVKKRNVSIKCTKIFFILWEDGMCYSDFVNRPNFGFEVHIKLQLQKFRRVEWPNCRLNFY